MTAIGWGIRQNFQICFIFNCSKVIRKKGAKFKKFSLFFLNRKFTKPSKDDFSLPADAPAQELLKKKNRNFKLGQAPYTR